MAAFLAFPFRPACGRECLFFPGLHSGASLKEPESKGRKGRKDQSTALFRGVNGALERLSPAATQAPSSSPELGSPNPSLRCNQEEAAQAVPLPTFLLSQRPLALARTQASLPHLSSKWLSIAQAVTRNTGYPSCVPVQIKPFGGLLEGPVNDSEEHQT